MSGLTKLIETTITEFRGDFSKVLRDVAIGLKNKGFFDQSNWSEELIKTFGGVNEIRIDNSILDATTDNEHEISSSFVDESSKVGKKSKTSSIQSPIECNSISNQHEDMFDNSNDSFEIPETQAYPPTDHQNDDDLDSEGFITMPEERIEADVGSQSQILLQGDELGKQSPFHPDFDDDDAIDLEMSKLEWDDSTKDFEKSKTASVASESNVGKSIEQMEREDSREASVTPDLDFHASNVGKSIEQMEDSREASVTPDLDFDALPTKMAESLLDSLASPKVSVVPSVSSSSDRNETKNDNSSICKEGQIKKINPIEKSNDAPLANNVDVADDVNDTSVSLGTKKEDDQSEKQVDVDHLFKKPLMPFHKPENQCGDDMAETQLFSKPAELAPDGPAETADECDEMAETQLFDKLDEFAASETMESNRSHNGSVANVSLDETQVFVKSNDRKADISHEDDVYDMATQALNVTSNKDDDVFKIPTKTSNVKALDKSNDRKAESIEDDDAYNMATQAFVVSNSRKRSHEEVDEGNNENEEEADQGAEDNDDAFDAATQKFETRKPIPQTPKRKRVSELKGSDWSTLCEEANNEQSKVAFKSVFDQCKDLRTELTKEVPVASKIKPTVVAEDAAPTRQSTRGRTKVKYTELTVAEIPTSKRQKVHMPPIVFEALPDPSDVSTSNEDPSPPIVFKAPPDPSDLSKSNDDPSLTTKTPNDSSSNGSTSTKSDDVPPTTIKSRASSLSSASSTSTNLDVLNVSEDLDEEMVAVGMKATQRFVKASSTPKELTKPVKVSTRRLLRSTTEEVPTSKAVKKLLPKLTANNSEQSVTYSPKPSTDVKKEANAKKATDVAKEAKVKASSDVNENIPAEPIPSVEVKTENAVSSRSRKRKAALPTEMRSLSTESNESLNSRSSSGNRSARIQNYSVMFTMIDPEPHRSTLKKLNISIAKTDKYNALITDKIYRTTKFMCALAAGKPIVSMNWLNQLKATKSMIDPFQFLLVDEAGEKKYKFSLAKTLSKVRKNGGLFRNHSILVTPNTSPSPDILKDIIASSGGKYLKTSLVARKGDEILCISDAQDKSLLAQLQKKYPGLIEITVEDFMQGIFQYQVRT